MNLKTIATTTLLIGLGLTQPLSAETIENVKQTVAKAKPIKVDLSRSSLPNNNAKQLYIQFGIQPFSYSPLYWSWGLFFGDYYDNYYDPFYSAFGYYGDRYYRNPYYGDRYYDYGDRYYGRRYRRGYNYYYSVDQIRDIYREVLGRDPDYRGLRTWLGERRSGDSLREIRRDIARSDEAVAKVNQIYREVLGRNADRNGIRTWTNRLAAGASLSEIRRDIENSPEARSLRNRRYPRYYNPSFNYSQPRRYTPPTTVYPPTRVSPSRGYSAPVRNFPTNNVPAVRYPNRNSPRNTTPAVRYPNRNFPRNTTPAVGFPNRNFPPATLSPSNRTPSRRYSPADNYQQPTRRYSPSRNNSPRIDYNRRNSGSTFSPAVPSSPPRIQR
ncbi:DUF4214 domain-containing protein [Aerosakkonemataceae cyanobacterium BLCC-F154]|uniref:DUF4214 domain-containing protein n=1 Tax=Floridaenema fluviatile BLCC-F154 TaxID=3153640 RepID=A0ABV4YJY5_9CYAN